MEFGIPPRNEEVMPFALRQPPKLRADGNLDYPQFMQLLRTLWAESHPDIPIRPSQSSKYSKYPVIVYSLEMRKTHATEPKKRFRELEYRVDDDTHLVISAQRFDNVITFTAMTEGNPELCEALIEAFEDFMMEYTPIFKQLGVSDFFYTRRLPDRDVTRPDQDIEERAVSYLVVLEKVIVTEVGKLEKILVKARIDLAKLQGGSEFWCGDIEDPDVSVPYLIAPNHPYRVGDIVTVGLPLTGQDTYAYARFFYAIPATLPDQLHPTYSYQISQIDGDKVYLNTLNGTPIVVRSNGMGMLYGASDLSGLIGAEIVDDFQSTPSY